MIDWISAVVPYGCNREIKGNTVICINQSGEINWQYDKGLEVEGSHSAKVLVKTLGYGEDKKTSLLYISGNPTKFLQGHNLFGSDDLRGLVYSFVTSVFKTLSIDNSDYYMALLADGTYHLKRVDCTASYALPTREDVRSWLRAASSVATARHQKKSAYSEQTLYFGQKSRRISLKAYCKGDEIEAHPLPVSLFEVDNEKARMLTKFADNLLRVEITIRAMELKRRGLDVGAKWEYNKPSNETWLSNSSQEIINERVKSLKLPENFKLNQETLRGLSPRIQMAYECWMQGKDLRVTLPRKTFYRYRSELLKHGIDISCPNPVEKKPENVVPLIRYLIAEPVGVPDWAIGTPFYHEPKEYLKYRKISSV